MSRLSKLILPTLLIGIFLIATTIQTARAQQLPMLYVDPPSMEVPVCSEFTVTIRIADVTDLCAWQFNITFDPALLECKGATEGPFLKSGGTTFFVIGAIDNDAGFVYVGCQLLPTGEPPVLPGVSGDGELAFVVFHCKGAGRSDLAFSTRTLLLVVVDNEPTEISYEPIGGSVTQYTRAVGGVLVPVNKFDILAPYLALVGLVGAVTVALAAKRRHKP